MANMSSIMKLHGNQSPQLRTLIPRAAPAKTDTVSDSEPDLLAMQTAAWQQPARRRFGSSGRIAAPAMMNSIAPASIPAGRADFASLAARDSAREMRATLARRYSQQARTGAAEHQQHGLAIQV
jgi:hypothetical protein